MAQIARYPDGSCILPLANRQGQTIELVKESDGMLTIAIRDVAGTGAMMMLSTAQSDQILSFLREAR